MPETRKDEIKWKKLIGAVISAILVGLPLFYIFGYEWEEYRYGFSYSIEIQQSGSGNFTVTVPFPDFDREDSHWSDRILQEMRTQSGPELTLVETEHGLGLELRSTEPCHLMIEYDIDVPVAFLTLDNDTTARVHRFYWLFGHFQNGTELEVHIFMMNKKTYAFKRAGDMDSWVSGGGPYIWLDIELGDLFIGWNQYIGDNSTLVIN